MALALDSSLCWVLGDRLAEELGQEQSAARIAVGKILSLTACHNELEGIGRILHDDGLLRLTVIDTAEGFQRKTLESHSISRPLQRAEKSSHCHFFLRL